MPFLEGVREPSHPVVSVKPIRVNTKHHPNKGQLDHAKPENHQNDAAPDKRLQEHQPDTKRNQ